ncbi:hypothetical protein HNR63_000590 [Anoxybacillus kamchatkensis]|nr:hypothetical protein [Anoxybacillus ayderensis]MBA2877556.1 hypothetical protein [Anoxybacillus ayderensis]
MLEDTSFAIRPVDQPDEAERWQPIGQVQKIGRKKANICIYVRAGIG